MTSDATKDLNRQQFGANAANYATSEPHVKGASLALMVDLAEPQAHERALDIATAAGHTAFAFAPHVASVVASDLTDEMVALATERAAELGHDNVTTQIADAESLPFDDDSFDIVTCRIAPHHFPNPAAFIGEGSRVLRPGGRFVLVDNVVPSEGDPDGSTGAFYNAWEKRRDPSHVRALSTAEWSDLAMASGLEVTHTEEVTKRMKFEPWLNNMSVPEDLRPGLLADLTDGPEGFRAYLRPEGATQQDAVFYLTEGVLVATA